MRRCRGALTLLAVPALLAVLTAACDGSDEPPLAPAPASTATVAAIATPTSAPTATVATPAAPAPATPAPVTSAEATAPPPPVASPVASSPPASPVASPVAPTAVAAPDAVGFAPALGGRVFRRPVELGGYPGGRLFVAEQDGLVLLFDGDGSNERVLLDIRSLVSREGDEEGLLSIALDPAFEASGHVWAYYSVAGGPRRTRLSRFTATADVAGASSELVVLEAPQPFSNHNGGAIRFGPDGMLYLGFGDGGAGGDPFGNGQNPSTLLGAIIRIDVRAATAAAPYAVPADNPLLATPGARPEVWAYGFRNPWRMAFDPATGALWVGDVGQDAVEEIDVVERGGNYGWNRLEGDRCFEPARGCDASGTIAPVATYGREGGCSVTGGVVYRGPALPSLAGWYVYGDFCSGRVWALAADLSGEPVLIAQTGLAISSFGVDAESEVYVLSFDAPVMRIVELEP